MPSHHVTELVVTDVQLVAHAGPEHEKYGVLHDRATMKRHTVLSATYKRRAATTFRLPTVDLPTAWLDAFANYFETFRND